MGESNGFALLVLIWHVAPAVLAGVFQVYQATAALEKAGCFLSIRRISPSSATSNEGPVRASWKVRASHYRLCQIAGPER